MSPKHHPPEEILIDYATGALDLHARLVVAGHVGVCPLCRRDVDVLNAVGGTLVAELPPVALADDALPRALARIERPQPAQAARLKPPGDWIRVPEPVLAAAERHRRWAAPGVWVAPVTGRPGRARSYLLGIAAGMKVPRHTHRGTEFVCVLKGAYVDQDQRHAPGDFALNDDSVVHQPTITGDSECVCLISATNRLVPRDWVGALFQPFVGI